MMNGDLLSRTRLFVDYFLSSRVKDSWSSAEKCQIVAFSHDVSRTEVRSGLFYSPLSDPLLDELAARGFRVQVFALWGSILTGNKSWLKPFSMNRAMTSAWFKSVLNRLLVRGKIDFKNSGPFQRNIYKEILLRTDAKIVISLMPPIDLVKACRSNGVLLVEVIHGFGYRELAGPHKGRERNLLPNVILVRDQITAKTYSPLRNLGCSVFLTLPFLNNEIHSLFSTHSVKTDSDRDVESPKHLLNVLVAVSHGGKLDRPFFDFASFAELFRSTNGVLNWKIRLHPIQAKSLRFGSFRRKMDDLVRDCPNSEWRTTTFMTGREAILGSSAVVTHFSEIVYDAAFLGRKSAVLWESPRDSSLDKFRQHLELKEEGIIRYFSIKDKKLVDWLVGLEECSPWMPPSQETLDVHGIASRLLELKSGNL